MPNTTFETRPPVYVAGAIKNGGTCEDFEHWTSRGAYGLQVGSRFALCRESGMREDLRAKITGNGARRELDVSTTLRSAQHDTRLDLLEFLITFPDNLTHVQRS